MKLAGTSWPLQCQALERARAEEETLAGEAEDVLQLLHM